MYKFVKRLLDILLAFVALVILSPIFLVTIILLLLTGEHYVFFFQKRVGHKNKPFNIWKFATMLKNSPNIGTGNITVRKDPRVLPIGRILRITKINELPQIINVLLGNMSIVGPRPLAISGFEKYPKEVQKTIYNVKPGITGIGSIVFRDEEAMITNLSVEEAKTMYKDVILPYKGALENWYQMNASILTDFLLIFLTAYVIISPKSDLTYRLFKDLPQKPKELINNK